MFHLLGSGSDIKGLLFSHHVTLGQLKPVCTEGQWVTYRDHLEPMMAVFLSSVICHLATAVNKEDDNCRFALPVWLATASLVRLTVVSDEFDARRFAEERVYEGWFSCLVARIWPCFCASIAAQVEPDSLCLTQTSVFPGWWDGIPAVIMQHRDEQTDWIGSRSANDVSPRSCKHTCERNNGFFSKSRSSRFVFSSR